MKTLITTLILLIFSVCINAQTSSFSIKGQLKDEDNKGVPFASVTVAKDSLSKKIVKYLSSDTNGDFNFYLSGEGKYYIIGTYLGKAPLIKSLNVSGGNRNLDLGVLIMKSSSKVLQGVTITASRPVVKVDMDKLVYDTTQDPETKTSNALDMLRKVPLVTVDGDDNIQIKGSSNFKILVNGKPSSLFANNPERVLKSMPANSIKNVEVITDPGAKYDAEGVKYLINIITNKENTDGYTGSIGAGINNRLTNNESVYLALKYGKIGFTTNMSFYNFRQPSSGSGSDQKVFSPANDLLSNGSTSVSSPGAFGNAILSYDIDSLNLLSVSYNRYSGQWNADFNLNNISSGIMNYQYTQTGRTSGQYGGFDFGVDYQKSFMKPGELLTFSYKLGITPDNSSTTSNIDILSGTPSIKNSYKTNSKAQTTENTFQADYVNPLDKKNTIEAGLKFIHRDNHSKGYYYNLDPNSNSYIEDQNFYTNSKFTQYQNILSGYGSYQIKLKQIGIKGGVRFDNTDQNLYFADNPKVKANFFNFIPSGVISYQISQTQNFKINYNMRISRPGISYLNPYENKTNPAYIQFGNPNLKTETSNGFDLSYSSFTRKLILNASIGYVWTNNAITGYQYIQNTNDSIVTYSTYGNIGKNRNVDFNLYLSWTPLTRLRTYFNGSASYIRSSNNQDASQSYHGIQCRLFGGGTYTFPKDIRLTADGGFFQFGVGYQSKKPMHGYFNSFSLAKDFLKNKQLTIQASVRNPFTYKQTFKQIKEGNNFWYSSWSDRIGQEVGINVSYRFGSLKSQIKKVQRTISNDDVKSGGGQGNDQQGQGGGN